uniref:Uncharacterized protein n=1 Tax=Picea glauca TaxID=3330 RepID=A0A101LW04_PICGL|nr:hypothetical protein ABT39_MTgene1857 [Picea glauca]
MSGSNQLTRGAMPRLLRVRTVACDVIPIRFYDIPGPSPRCVRAEKRDNNLIIIIIGGLSLVLVKRACEVYSRFSL